MTSPPVPPQAITAAAKALPALDSPAWLDDEAVVRCVLEAAAPHLAAGEWEGPGVDVETMIEAASERRRVVKARCEERIAEAVAAERERILAEAAKLRRSFQGVAKNVIAYSDLAALLEAQP